MCYNNMFKINYIVVSGIIQSVIGQFFYKPSSSVADHNSESPFSGSRD